MLLRLLAHQSDAQGLAEGTKAASLIERAAIAPSLRGGDLQRRRHADRAGRAEHEREPRRAERSGRAAAAARPRRQRRLRLRRRRRRDGRPSTTAPSTPRTARPTAELTYLNEDDDAVDGGSRPSGRRGLRAARLGADGRADRRRRALPALRADRRRHLERASSAVTLTLSLGLLAVWAALLAVSVSVTRRLRREARINAVLANDDALTGLPNRGRFLRADQRAHRAGQPGSAGRGRGPRHRPVPGDQRHARARQRRPADRRPWPTGCRLECATPTSSPASAATSSASCWPTSAHDAHGDVDRGARRLRKASREPIEIDGLPLAVEASIGYAVAPLDGMDAGLLMQRADVAMYVGQGPAPRRRRLLRRPRPLQLGRAAPGRRTGRGDRGRPARAALPAQGRPAPPTRSTSVEALVRWNHPTLGACSTPTRSCRRSSRPS